MKYFRIKQDFSLTYPLRLRDFEMTGPHKTFTKEEAGELNDVSVIYLAGNGDEACPDFIQNPIYMVSEKIAKVFDMYEENLILKKVQMIHKETGRYHTFFHVVTDQLEVLSEKTCFYPDGREKLLVLDQKKIGEHAVFQVKDGREHPFVINLDVAESIFRRNVIGIRLEEIEVS